jgi:hypothetical protein
MTSTNEVDESSSLAPDGNDREAVCYLCLGGGADEADQPLRRDCACRGTDAGFVHLSCLTNFAETKSKQARGMNEFIKSWKTCPSCLQEYKNDFSIDIATKFVSFVQRQYPKDTPKQVEALDAKLAALNNMLGRLQHVQKREAGVTATVLLSLIDRIKTEASPLPERYSRYKASVYHTLGRIALNEGSEESARRAVTHFENQLEVCEAISNDNDEGIVLAKASIAYAKSKYESGNNNEDLLKSTQDVYKLRAAANGEDDEYTIHAGKDYAIALWKANRGDEAMKLRFKLLATSMQVLGPHHSTTKEIESMLV